jgi:hypothetical protein
LLLSDGLLAEACAVESSQKIQKISLTKGSIAFDDEIMLEPFKSLQLPCKMVLTLYLEQKF